MPTYELTSPSGKKYRVNAPEGATEAQVLSYAKSQFGSLENQPAQQRQVRSFDNTSDGLVPSEQMVYGPEGGDKTLQAIKNVGEGAAQFGTGMFGAAAGDVAGLGALGYDIVANGVMHPFSGATPGGFADPAAIRERVANYLTYRPSDPESLTSKVLGYPGKVIGGAGEALAQVTDNPYAQDVLRAAPQAAAAYLGVRAATPATIETRTPALVNGRATTQTGRVQVPEKFVPAPLKGTSPEARAQNYVERRTNLDWGSLPQTLRTKLVDIAKTSGRLERLDATALERQAILGSLDAPITNATRGQLTRNPLQQRQEQLAKATEEGQVLRDLDIDQNKRLIQNLDILRGKTGGKAAGEIEQGRSVQDALRARFNQENVKVTRLYKEAEAAGELQGPVNIDPLVEYLKTHDDPAQVSYVVNRLKQLGAIKEETNGGITVQQNRPLTLAQLEGIRRASVAAGKNGGTAGHYAKEVKNVIDAITEGAGGEKYAQARAARRAIGDEFERQQAVSRLVKNRKMSSDRAVALEDTWHKTVLSGSLEDLQKVRASLGQSPGGTAAWADLQAATIDYIKNRATGGKLGLKNEAGDLNSTWAGLRRAVDEIGPDKMREIFGEQGARSIDNIVESAQILKTEAPTGVKGSPTIDKFLTLLDRVPVVRGAATKIKQLHDIGKTGREIKRAQTSPLDDK